MPFLKFSNTEYYSITSIAYFFTVALMFILNAFLGVESGTKLAQFNWEFLTTCCAIVEPIITFIIPGYYFYKMSIKNELR
jgi:hypothetical protein